MCYCAVLQCVFKLHIKTTIVIKYINEHQMIIEDHNYPPLLKFSSEHFLIFIVRNGTATQVRQSVHTVALKMKLN